MGTLISVAIVIVCVLLILVVLVQNSKGGGLASNFSSSNQVMGVRKTADFLEKATWTLAVALLLLSLLSVAFRTKKGEETTNAGGSKTKKAGEEKGSTAPTTTGTNAPKTLPINISNDTAK